MNAPLYLLSSHDVLGFLEKKKDYKLRADDYNNKKQVLKHLRKKALNKNPDEFYFHMTNSKIVDGGLHRDLVSKKTKDKSESASSKDQVRLMQTQDYKYVSMRRVMEQRKIEKLKGALHLLDKTTDNTGKILARLLQRVIYYSVVRRIFKNY